MNLIIFALMLAAACYQTGRAIRAHLDYYRLKRELDQKRK